MTELKTLKDLNKDYIWTTSWTTLDKDIKKEAIKWVKPSDWGEFWKWCKIKKGFDYLDENVEPIKFIEAFIEFFFNITEEEIKENE